MGLVVRADDWSGCNAAPPSIFGPRHAFWFQVAAVASCTRSWVGPKKKDSTDETDGAPLLQKSNAQCGTQLERVLEQYSALNDKLVPSQRCADCRIASTAVRLQDPRREPLRDEQEDVASPCSADFDGVYEINDATQDGRRSLTAHGQA